MSLTKYEQKCLDRVDQQEFLQWLNARIERLELRAIETDKLLEYRQYLTQEDYPL